MFLIIIITIIDNSHIVLDSISKGDPGALRYILLGIIIYIYTYGLSGILSTTVIFFELYNPRSLIMMPFTAYIPNNVSMRSSFFNRANSMLVLIFIRLLFILTSSMQI